MALLHLMTPLIGMAEAGRLPDPLVRTGIRRLLKARLTELEALTPDQQMQQFRSFAEQAWSGPIAVLPEKANEQHYEVPAEFFGLVLGARRKYSCCWWDDSTKTLEQAEDNALRITCEHAQLADGQHILELGCGWGSLSLWMAEHYPGGFPSPPSPTHTHKDSTSRLKPHAVDCTTWKSSQPISTIF